MGVVDSNILQALQSADVLSPLDVHFAKAIESIAPGQSMEVQLGAAFASRAIRMGHICADLRRILSKPLVDSEGTEVPITLPPIFEWVMQLGQSKAVGDGQHATPLVFDGEARLYLTRYWQYQTQIATALRARALDRPASPIDQERLCNGLDRLFQATETQQPDPFQRLAAAVATLRQLAVISGGPGTGKTTTVVRVLALLIEQAFVIGDEPPRILLLAPTGKAAARLAESIAAGRDRLDLDADVLECIPATASTIHRSLGVRPHTPTRFIHHADNPLPADVVLVDEASMVDAALMAKLLAAVPPSARLILLGDKDQLASVEAGSILGDICHATNHDYSLEFVQQLKSILGPEVRAHINAKYDQPGIWDCVVELKHSFRFSTEGGIGRLATSIKQGQGREAIAQLQGPDPTISIEELRGEPVPLVELQSVVLTRVIDALQPYFQARSPQDRLHTLNHYRLLAANRHGLYGTLNLNAMIERGLELRGTIERRFDQAWYDGQPVLITQNDYQLQLFNGDIGVIGPDDTGRLRAYFPGVDGTRAFLPSRLPPHESVYAMTVHKSQGSEFNRIGLVLPPAMSPLLTRELLYTAITRARTQLSVFGTDQVIIDAIERRVDRASGLTEALWQP